MQGRIVRSVLTGRDTLGVLPTGGGKSVCFQVPAMVLGGFTVVISPLIALMEDQVRAARSRGLAAASLAGPLEPAEISAVFDRIARGEVRLLYTSPERLGGRRCTDRPGPPAGAARG
jgi:ATP-dependent DNA helicase RecQ